MVESGIYMIKNEENGKCYIGSSVNIRKRIETHRQYLVSGRHPNKHLQDAWSKYGKMVFSFAVLERCEWTMLMQREQAWIDYYDASNRNKGYNMCPHAYSVLGRKYTPEQLDDHRKRQRKYYEKHRNILIQMNKKALQRGAGFKVGHATWNKGKTPKDWMSEEKYNKWLENKTKKYEKGRQAWNKGKPMSEEQKINISKALIGQKRRRD